MQLLLFSHSSSLIFSFWLLPGRRHEARLTNGVIQHTYSSVIFNRNRKWMCEESKMLPSLFLYSVVWWEVLLCFLGGFNLSIYVYGGDNSGVFSLNLLHVHIKTARILHIAVDLHNLWHHWYISDALGSFSMESIFMYSASVLQGGSQFTFTWSYVQHTE